MELSIMFTYHPHTFRFVITDAFIYDNQQSVRELINLRDSYAIWARKLSIVPATSDEYTATIAELGNIHHHPSCRQGKDELPLFRLPTYLSRPWTPSSKKVEEQRIHQTPVMTPLQRDCSI
ncbi:hypothetical protein TNCV_3399101 [Trichonephila clavipes]|nr:hypothetical protein TNCV_3399101 [Trichonephila clavipes]